MRRFLLIIIFIFFFIPHTKAFAQTVCGPCNSAGVFYCDFPGGFTVTDCGVYVPKPSPPAPTSTSAPVQGGLTLSPTHGCLNTTIHATINGLSLTPGYLSIAYFNNAGTPGPSGFEMLQGFVNWVSNGITIVPNQTMQYGLPPTGSNIGALTQVTNNLDYTALTGSKAYPITFTFNGNNSPIPANVSANYTVDASCFPAAPTNTPIPTHVPTPTFTPVPTNMPIPTPTPSCHMVQTCPTGENGNLQLCTFTCE